MLYYAVLNKTVAADDGRLKSDTRLICGEEKTG